MYFGDRVLSHELPDDSKHCISLLVKESLSIYGNNFNYGLTCVEQHVKVITSFEDVLSAMIYFVDIDHIWSYFVEEIYQNETI